MRMGFKADTRICVIMVSFCGIKNFAVIFYAQVSLHKLCLLNAVFAFLGLQSLDCLNALYHFLHFVSFGLIHYAH